MKRGESLVQSEFVEKKPREKKYEFYHFYGLYKKLHKMEKKGLQEKGASASPAPGSEFFWGQFQRSVQIRGVFVRGGGYYVLLIIL